MFFLPTLLPNIASRLVLQGLSERLEHTKALKMSIAKAEHANRAANEIKSAFEKKSMTIIKFSKPEKEEQHITGEAVCGTCAHEWVAVAPVGTTELQCPACHVEKGHFKHWCAPEVGSQIYQCNCGNELFWITPNGCVCRGCGVTAQF